MDAQARAVCDKLYDLSLAIEANDATRTILVAYLEETIAKAKAIQDTLMGDDWLAMESNLENADYMASGISSKT